MYYDMSEHCVCLYYISLHERKCLLYMSLYISAFVFPTRIVQFLFYLNQKFQASSSFLCLYRSVCVGPDRKPHCLFSHEVAHILNVEFYII